jgi:low temperature requirement protein LtrA
LAAVWRAWVCYTWLGLASRGVTTFTRTLLLLAMAAMLVAATALPDAFGRQALVFGCAYFAVRVLHVVLFVFVARHDAEVRVAVVRLTPSWLTGPALVVVAAFVGTPYREALWIVGGLIDYGGPAVAGMRGWRVPPTYFVERYGQIVIIALGETIVEVGAGARSGLGRADVLIGIVLAMLISGSLWWAYFGNVRIGARKRLAITRGVERARLARDSYNYLHLPLIAGTVFFAVGVHESLPHLDRALPLLQAVALAGGVALFFAADVAIRWRDHHQIAWDRLVAGVGALIVIPIAMTAPALVALAALTLLCALWTAWELWRRPVIGLVRAA